MKKDEKEWQRQLNSTVYSQLWTTGNKKINWMPKVGRPQTFKWSTLQLFYVYVQNNSSNATASQLTIKNKICEVVS